MSAQWVPSPVGRMNHIVLRGSVDAHYVREDGVYAILEFGACRESAQAFADRLNAAGHVGQTVPAALVGGES